MKEEKRLGESKEKIDGDENNSNQINGNQWTNKILSALLTLCVYSLGEAGGSFETGSYLFPTAQVSNAHGRKVTDKYQAS